MDKLQGVSESGPWNCVQNVDHRPEFLSDSQMGLWPNKRLRTIELKSLKVSEVPRKLHWTFSSLFCPAVHSPGPRQRCLRRGEETAQDRRRLHSCLWGAYLVFGKCEQQISLLPRPPHKKKICWLVSTMKYPVVESDPEPQSLGRYPWGGDVPTKTWTVGRRQPWGDVGKHVAHWRNHSTGPMTCEEAGTFEGPGPVFKLNEGVGSSQIT